MIQALIFDFDGLILDTEVPEFRSWQEVFQEHGCKLEPAVWVDSIGTAPGSFDPYAHLESISGRACDREALRERRRQRYRELVAAEEVLPGIMDYLADARRLGLKIAVASSSPHEWVDGHLERLGINEHFLSVHCFDDVERAKPDPDLYLRALEALQVGPHEAIALEDSPNGVRAARAAGIFCVAIPNAMTRSLPLEHANLRLHSLADLPLGDLIRIAEQYHQHSTPECGTPGHDAR